MAEKNAYEIRLEVLQMAKDLLMDEYYTKKDDIKFLLEEGDLSMSDIDDLPSFPTNKQIVDKAEELYKFVQ